VEGEGARTNVRRYSQCGELGHYKNKCRNPRVDYVGIKANGVVVDNLFIP